MSTELIVINERIDLVVMQLLWVRKKIKNNLPSRRCLICCGRSRVWRWTWTIKVEKVKLTKKVFDIYHLSTFDRRLFIFRSSYPFLTLFLQKSFVFRINTGVLFSFPWGSSGRRKTYWFHDSWLEWLLGS